MVSPKSPTSHRGKLTLPSLVLARFATQPSGLIMGLLLIEISQTFSVPVGVAGQIGAFSSLIGLIFALLMGILSVKYNHKSLLLIGILAYSICALGCYITPNYWMMMGAFSLSGIGMAMVRPMTPAIVGENIPLERRSHAVGWLIAGGSISYLIGAPIVGYIANQWGWRTTFLVYMFPVSIVSLFLAYVGIPGKRTTSESERKEVNYLDGFRKVFKNRSAIACLLGASLGMAAWTATLSYSISFFRQRFSVSTSWASLILSGLALCFTAGSLSSGYLINVFGRKKFTVISTLLLGMVTITFMNLGVFWLSLALAFISCIVAGMRYSSSDNLTLEQIPEFRGTMMSISSAASSLGSTLGAGIGGVTLVLWSYGGLGLTLGSFGIVAAAVYLLFAIDPALK